MRRFLIMLIGLSLAIIMSTVAQAQIETREGAEQVAEWVAYVPGPNETHIRTEIQWRCTIDGVEGDWEPTTPLEVLSPATSVGITFAVGSLAQLRQRNVVMVENQEVIGDFCEGPQYLIIEGRPACGEPTLRP